MKLTKITLSVIAALGISGLANAAMYAPPAPKTCQNGVSEPCQMNTWSVGVQGLWVEQTNDDMHYATSSYTQANGSGGTDTINREHVIDPRFRFGFRLDGTYYFRQGHYANVNWTRIHTDTGTSTANLPTGGSPTLTPRYPYLVGGGFTVDQVSAKSEFEFDQVNGEIGQLFNAGRFVTMKGFIGLSYLRINQLIQVNAHSVPSSGPNDGIGIAKDRSEFSGIGPRAGGNITFNLYDNARSNFNIGLTGGAAGSLVVGDVDNTVECGYLTYDGNGNIVAGPNDTHKSEYPDERTVVPTLEANIGVRSTYRMNMGTVGFEVGYKAFAAVHAIKHQGSMSNYGHHGAYLTLDYLA